MTVFARSSNDSALQSGWTFRLSSTLAGKGADPTHFRSTLRGIAVDAMGQVTAVGDRLVKVFRRDGSLLREWPTTHPGISVAVASDGRVFVGQSGGIEIFDPEGRLLDVWQDRERLGLVTAIDLYEEHVFAADARARVIRRYGTEGRLELSIGRPGRRGFAIPGGFLDFSIDADGVIHAANPGKHRVESYSRDGDLLGSFGRFGMQDPADFRGCCNPINIAVSSDGAVAVTEKAPPRAKLFDREGSLLAVIDAAAFDAGCKYMDIAVGRRGRLYVADTVRLQVCVFDRVGTDSKPTSPAGEGARDD